MKTTTEIEKNVKSKAQATNEKITEVLRLADEIRKDKVKGAQTQLNDSFEKGKKTLLEAQAQINEKYTEVKDQSAEKIKKNPFLAVMLSGVVGVLVGVFLTRGTKK